MLDGDLISKRRQVIVNQTAKLSVVVDNKDACARVERSVR